MKKTRKFSILTAILLSFALLFIIPASAERTWTATFEGDITGTMTITLTKGYWWGTFATLTFVDPVSDPDYWLCSDGKDFADSQYPISVQTQRPPQGETVLNIRLGGGTGGDYVLLVRATIDYTLSPGNVVITSVPSPSGTWHIQHNGLSVWDGNPSFTITIPLA